MLYFSSRARMGGGSSNQSIKTSESIGLDGVKLKQNYALLEKGLT